MGDASAEGQKVLYLCISVFLVLMAGLMSGLTLGLMSLDQVDLEVLLRSGTPTEKKYAARISPVVSKPHHTLVTLLLCNAVALEALPIFLDRLVNPVTAVVLSVTVVLFFGEIVPQAICSHYGLAIGAWTAWFVRFLMIATAIISWPISKLLDYLLGAEHTALFRRGQLKALVDLHSETEGLGGQLAAEEINVIRGALDLTNKTAAKGMTPLEKVRMLSADAVLDEEALRGILQAGHSRVPVHRPGSRKEILGIVLVKELVLIDMHAKTRVADLRIRSLPYLRADIAMYDLLKLFQTGRSHMVVLTKPPPAADGTVSRANSTDVTLQIEEAKDRVSPEQQPLLHQSTLSPKGKEQAEEQAPQDGPIANGHEAGSSSETNAGSSSKADTWNAVVAAEVNEPVGIITIEDVLEELIGQEILDETDQFVDNEMQHAVNTANLVKNLPPQLRNSLKLRQGLSRSRSGRISITHEGAALATGNKPSPRRNLSAVRPSSSVTVKRKTGADNQTMDILEPLLQSPSENEK
ncbi:MAG: DUF21 domain-containing protein [Trebouxia sp. A1-2]|nr:MAG: DUF21 domain-containing protein [Trebouxia sp. A1-2]